MADIKVLAFDTGGTVLEQFPVETRAIGVSLGVNTPGVDLRRPCAASGNVADFRPGDRAII
jgi:hypothetical protein